MRHFIDPIVGGLDTETYEGEPLTYQLHCEAEPRLTKIEFVDATNVTRKFLAHLDRNCKSPYYRFYVHNLAFDLVELFWPVKEQLVTSDGTFEFKIGTWNISGIYGTPSFCRLVHNKRRICVELVDSMLWFKTSLAQAAEQFRPDLPKLPRLDGLGTKRFTRRDSLFVEYAKRDAEVSCSLGTLIEMMHKRLGVAPSMSLASMAAAVFSQHYITKPIQQVPNQEVMRAAISAYHGGRNNVRPNAAPGWHLGVSAYDLSSAYPYAMTCLPGFTDPNAWTEARISPSSKRVPEVGIYCITGRQYPCEWPALYDHGFKPLKGDFERVWVHGTELNSALATGEVKLRSIDRAFLYTADDESPMARFAEYFYRMKSEAADAVERFMYKIVLNSLSGKFIQRRDVVTIDEYGEPKTVTVAGGLFQPFIAGAITAHTRGIMHTLEHESHALHTATDGIFAYRKPSLSTLPREGLGSLQHEGTGDLALLRCKLYALYGTLEDKGPISWAFKDKRVIKYAMHGFQGRLADFEHLIATGRRRYTVIKPNTLRDALNRGLVPNKFEERLYVLKVGPMKVHSATHWR